MKLVLGKRSYDIGTWSYGVLSAFLQGGATALTAGIGVTLWDPAKWNYKSANIYELMLAVFAAHGLYEALKYISKNPLPKKPVPSIPLPPIIKKGR